MVPAEPPSPARARVLESLAHHTMEVSRGWPDPDLRAAAEEAVLTARRCGDAATESAAPSTIACAELIGGNVERLRALLAQARSLAAQVGAYQPLLRAAITESDVLEAAGLHELAADVAREGLATAREHGLARTYGAVLAINVAEPLTSLGRWDEAGEVIERALQLVPPRVARTSVWRLAGDMALARGDLAAAAESVASMRSVLEHTRYRDQYHTPLARLEAEVLLAQGQPAEALTVVEAAHSHFDELPDSRYVWPLLVAGARACGVAAAAGARGEALTARAAALRGRLRTEAGRRPAEERAQQAHRLTFAAETGFDDALAGTEPGDGDRAKAWDEAAQAWESLGEPYPLALALLGSAEAAVAAGDCEGGATRLYRAAALARSLGASPLTDDIALSPGEVHVSNILGKLSVATRGEAAAIAHRLRLFDYPQP